MASNSIHAEIFSRIAETTHDAIVLINEYHEVLFWNAAATKIFGYTTDEMMGKSILTIIPDQFKANHLEGVTRYVKTEKPSVMGRPVELTGTKKSGEVFPIELTISSWKEGSNHYFSGIIRDITERKTAQRRFNSIIETSNDAIILIEENNTVVGWNAAAAKIFGYTPAEMFGKSILTIIPEKYKVHHMEGLNRYIQTGVPRVMGCPVELTGTKKSGEEFPIELTISSWKEGKSHYFSGIIRDISERKNAEQQIKKKNDQLAFEKDLVEIKQKEITDSIRYAQRIQQAILPSIQAIKDCFSNSFVLYKPKDVVAGDFYWMEVVNDHPEERGDYRGKDTIYLAVADCTGHGVPGAIISVICAGALTKALVEEGVTKTGSILDRTREIIIDRLGKSGGELKDGMDISLCSIDCNRNILEWSGANNPLWIMRDDKLLEFNQDRQPVGLYLKPLPFTTHTFTLKPKDRVYLFTDGFQDQFGGEKGKKLKIARFKEELINMQHLSIDNQQKCLECLFEDWRGNYEQVDDICIVGIEI